MSLLEDVFLQDEANEAEELERVIEGDEFDDRRRSDSDENSEKEDEAEEDKRRVDPTKTKATRVIKNPRFLLNPARLTGPRGIQVIPEHFKDFKFKGKGYEKEDLDLVLKKLEHWAYRLYPKFQFEDCLKKIETLGKKRPVAVHLHKIRSDQFLSEDTVVQKDSSDEDIPTPVQEEDEFDKLLQQQIELARSTPAPNSAKKPDYDGSLSPTNKRTASLMMPKATSSPSINNEQRERMQRSRRLAEERRLARLKNVVNEVNSNSILVRNNIQPTHIKNITSNSDMEHSEEINKGADEMAVSKKHNRSNVIDSSDEESTLETNVSVAVDVHTSKNIADKNGMIEIEKSIHSTINMSDSDADEAEELERKTKDGEHTTLNVPSQIIETNKLITPTEDNILKDIQSNMPAITDGEDDTNPILTGNISEKSVLNDELRYDDSDINIDLNKDNTDNIDNNSKHNCIIDSENEKNLRSSKNIEDMGKGLDRETLCSTEVINVKNEASPTSEPKKILDNACDETIDKIQCSPEQFEDVMDVDFTEDF